MQRKSTLQLAMTAKNRNNDMSHYSNILQKILHITQVATS